MKALFVAHSGELSGGANRTLLTLMAGLREQYGVSPGILIPGQNTPLEQLWRDGKVEVLEQKEYFEIVARALELLPEETVVHRLTGDGPKSLLLAPMWTADKRQVVNYINRRFKR